MHACLLGKCAQPSESHIASALRCSGENTTPQFPDGDSCPLGEPQFPDWRFLSSRESPPCPVSRLGICVLNLGAVGRGGPRGQKPLIWEQVWGFFGIQALWDKFNAKISCIICLVDLIEVANFRLFSPLRLGILILRCVMVPNCLHQECSRLVLS